jgi:thioredoxin 2
MNSPFFRTCPSCGASNRIPARHLADKGRCGSCKAALPPTSEPIEVQSEAQFDEITRDANVPVLTDFWAEWCGPCRMAAPEVKALASEVAGRALVLKVDTESLPNLAARYRVQSIPNFILTRSGRLIKQQAGMAPRAEMRRWIESA